MAKIETPKETVADIIAEMRMGNAGDFPFAYMIVDPDTPEVIDFTTRKVVEPRKINIRCVTVSNLADRLEAAWKRQEQCYLDQIRDAVNMIGHERFVAKHPPVGNAAAMRDALENAYSLLCEGIATEVDDELKHPFHLELACEKIQNALAEPARNCDLYATATEALKAQDVAFNEDNFKNGECRLGCPGCDDGLIDCKILWLFAPAAERKGDGDGR